MGLSLRAQAAVREEALARFDRHKKAWQEAREAKQRWREEMLTADLAAEMLGISTRTLRRWANEGKLPRIRLGQFDQSPIRFRRSDVEQFKQGIRSCSPSAPHRRLPGK